MPNKEIKLMKEIPYKYIALGILIGYLSPYVIELIKSFKETSPSLKEPLATYGN